MAITKVSPMLVTFLVRSTRAIRSASGAMSAERSSQKKSISGLNQASEQFDFKRSGFIQRNKSTVGGKSRLLKLRRGLAQRIAPILCAGKDSSRPSKGRVARDLVASTFRHSEIRRVKVPCCPMSRNLEPRKRQRRPKSGPQHYGAISAVHPQETPGAQLGSFPFRPSQVHGSRYNIVGRFQNHQI